MTRGGNPVHNRVVIGAREAPPEAGADAGPPASAAVWAWRAAADGDPSAAGRTRRRGVTRGAVALGVALLLALWKPAAGAVAAGLALLVVTVALASPLALYPRIERGLAAFGRAVALGVTWTALGAVYFLVFVPLGLVLRARGRLRIARALDRDAASYWRPADPTRATPDRYERQF